MIYCPSTHKETFNTNIMNNWVGCFLKLYQNDYEDYVINLDDNDFEEKVKGQVGSVLYFACFSNKYISGNNPHLLLCLQLFTTQVPNINIRTLKAKKKI